MTVAAIKTDAETGLAERFAAAKPRLTGATALREAAFRRFEKAGLPSRRVEDWKYTDLRTLMRDAKPLAAAPDAAAKARAKAAVALAGVEARRLVFVDGAFAPELSDLAGLEAGLKVGSLAAALARNDAAVTARLGEPGPADANPAFALNTAFMADGALIEIAPKADIARPIHLVFATTSEKAVAVYTRSQIVIGAGARVRLIESHAGPDGVDYQVNTVVDMRVGDGADVERVKFGIDGDAALHLATLVAALGRNVNFRDFIFTTGGAVARNQLFAACNGPGSELGLRGASLLKRRQHADTTLVLDHAIGHCQSRELYKSALDGDSRAVFQGKIIVRPDAQKTDARMMSQALLLSETAEADNKPELEIFADDVQCGHGATAGALDENLKFYLMARGIPERDAEALLIESFVGEAVDNVTAESVRDVLMAAVRAWLAARG